MSNNDLLVSKYMDISKNELLLLIKSYFTFKISRFPLIFTVDRQKFASQHCVLPKLES